MTNFLPTDRFFLRAITDQATLNPIFLAVRFRSAHKLPSSDVKWVVNGSKNC
jgi:hypothetical protein